MGAGFRSLLAHWIGGAGIVPPPTVPTAQILVTTHAPHISEAIHIPAAALTITTHAPAGVPGEPTSIPPTGRYVKFSFTDNWGDADYVCMGLLYACNAAGVKWNNETMPHTSGTDGSEVAGVPLNMSKEYPGDGNNLWQTYKPGSGGSPNPNWWKVDLGVSRSIAIIKTRVYNGYDYRNFKNFTVSVSDDDINWTLILTAQTTLDLYNPRIQSFEVPHIPVPGAVTASPPVAPLAVTTHAPTWMISGAMIPAATLIMSAFAPLGLTPGVATVPTVALSINAVPTSPAELECRRGLWNPSGGGATLVGKACLIDGDLQADCVGVAETGTAAGADLGEPLTVTSLRVHLRTMTNQFDPTWHQSAGSVIVSTSDDNVIYTIQETFVAPTLVKDGDYLGHFNLSLATPVRARYVKIDGLGYWFQTTGVELLRCTEIKVYGGTAIAADVSSASFPHFSDNVSGAPENISDKNVYTYVREMTYIAVDLGSPVLLTGFQLNLISSTNVAKLNGALFQGSNDSTNGVDGAWTTLHTILSSELVSGYLWSGVLSLPGTTAYRLYRISGLPTPADANATINEWRLLSPVAGGIPRVWSFARSSAPYAGLVATPWESTFSFLLRSLPPAIALTLAARNPSAVWSLPASMLPAAQVIYLCTLTGAADGVADVVIPISSFQARLRNGDPSYLACVIPNSVDWEAAITARPNGEIIIRKGYRLVDGTVNLEEIARVNFETLQVDRGARNDSATLVGHKTVTATAPKEWTVSGVSFYGLQADGKRRIRAAMDLFLRPGDTVIYGTDPADSFIAGSITYIINTIQGIMEVAEE